MAVTSSSSAAGSSVGTHHPTRKAADERRIEICRAALRVIAERGFAGTTLRDVAGEAGVAHGLLRHHFGGRDALLAAAFDLAATEAIAAYAEEPADTVDALRWWLIPPSRDHYLLWIDAWSEAPRSIELHATLVRHERQCENGLKALLDRGVAEGVFTRVLPSAAAASAIIATMDGLAVQDHALAMIGSRAAATRLAAVVEPLVGLDSGSL